MFFICGLQRSVREWAELVRCCKELVCLSLVSVVCCQVEVFCPCDRPIPRPEESYRLCCVSVCDLETSRM